MLYLYFLEYMENVVYHLVWIKELIFTSMRMTILTGYNQIQCLTYIVKGIMYTVQSKVYIIYCIIIYNVQSVMYTVQCTMYGCTHINDKYTYLIIRATMYNV